MGKRLNIQPQVLTSTPANLLNGAFASLSGPVGFIPAQPRIHVTGALVVIGSADVSAVLYKGASGEGASGSEVLDAPSSGYYPLDLVLESSDFLTGKYSGSDSPTVVVTLSATIDFGD